MMGLRDINRQHNRRTMNKRQALLIGQNHGLMRAIPNLLDRAGFVVDILCTYQSTNPDNAIRNIFFCKEPKCLATVATELKNNYTLIVVGDDETLKLIATSDLPDAEKIRLLPINKIKQIHHLYSKIGLSAALLKSDVNMPDFLVVQNNENLQTLCAQLGYPLFVKIDNSFGGSGVFQCIHSNDIEHLKTKNLSFPLIIQRKVIGDEIDLSGFFQNGRLIHFSHSIVEEHSDNPFGPAKLKTYTQLGLLNKAFFDELNVIGLTLGIDGFANISCIQSKQNNKRYYFEVDLRPTVWSDYPKYFGDDPAIPIKAYFDRNTTISYPYTLNSNFPGKTKLPYFLRMSTKELLINRHNVWKYIDESGFRQLRAIFGLKSIHLFEKSFHKLFAVLIPRKLLQALRPIYLDIKNKLISMLF
jgi:hypothetical protein